MAVRPARQVGERRIRRMEGWLTILVRVRKARSVLVSGHVTPPRPSVLSSIALAATLLGALALHAGPSRKATPVQEREARAFLETVSGRVQPLQTVANQAAWTAATDVTPEHTAARTAAEKALASVSGSKLVIEKTRALLKAEERSRCALGAPAHQAAARRRRQPSHHSRGCRQAHRSRVAPILDPGRLHLLPANQSERRLPAPGLGQRPRRHPSQIAQPERARAGLGRRRRRSAASSSLAWPSCKPCATRSRARWAIRRSSPCKSRTTA
jgi:hypothetical protein